VKGGSPLKNAAVHCGQKALARVDVKNCYPSITNSMVFRLFRALGLGPGPASLLTKLCTRRGHLPQGAPTSDMITNLVLSPVDCRVREIATTLRLKRSRCLDDFAVSGGAATRKAIPLIIDAIRDVGLAVRHKKTGNAGATRAHVLTGYGVDAPEHPTVMRSKTQEIRTTVLRFVAAHQRGEATSKMLLSVKGSLSYLRRTNPGLVRRLEQQLARAGIFISEKVSAR
jgi:RNA-directed DNA polymerase